MRSNALAAVPDQGRRAPNGARRSRLLERLGHYPALARMVAGKAGLLGVDFFIDMSTPLQLS
jgi:hypothetical protein